MNKLILAAASLTIFLCGPAIAGDPAAGQKLSQTCVACHGPDGNSPSPESVKLYRWVGRPRDFCSTWCRANPSRSSCARCRRTPIAVILSSALNCAAVLGPEVFSRYTILSRVRLASCSRD